MVTMDYFASEDVSDRVIRRELYLEFVAGILVADQSLDAGDVDSVLDFAGDDLEYVGIR